MKNSSSETIEMFQDLPPAAVSVVPKETVDASTYNEIGRFAREALAGDVATARARLRRLLPKLGRVEPLLAEALRTAVGGSSIIRGKVFAQAPTDADSRQNLVFTTYPVKLQFQPTFSECIDSVLAGVIKEWRCADELFLAGLAPSRSMLFSGPPGVGKSLAASYLANALDLPLLTLDLATVMSSYLGKTGSNLRTVLDYAQSFPCVLFLDEFDTIAKRRNDDSDVGELKRLVTVLLQSIDQWPSNSLLIAATNHGELLDPAVWRRFDVTAEFSLPDESAREDFFINADVPPLVAKKIATATQEKNYSALERILLAAKKEAILSNTNFIAVLARQHGLELAIPVLKPKKKPKLKSEKDEQREGRNLEILRLDAAGESSRDIGDILGISHTTVVRFLKKIKGNTVGETKPIDRERRKPD